MPTSHTYINILVFTNIFSKHNLPAPPSRSPPAANPQGVYASLLTQLASPQQQQQPQAAAAAAAVLRCAVGQIYDSGPVDFSSDMVSQVALRQACTGVMQGFIGLVDTNTDIGCG